MRGRDLSVSRTKCREYHGVRKVKVDWEEALGLGLEDMRVTF